MSWWYVCYDSSPPFSHAGHTRRRRVHTHTHTSTKCIGAVDGQKEGVLVGCKRGLMEMLPGQPVSQHSSDPGNACGLLNQWQY